MREKQTCFKRIGTALIAACIAIMLLCGLALVHPTVSVRAAEGDTSDPAPAQTTTSILKAYSRPEAGYISLGIQFDYATTGEYVDEIGNPGRNYGYTFLDGILINGKSVSQWRIPVDIKKNMSAWSGAMKDMATGTQADAPDANKLWLHISFPVGSFNMADDAMDVITIKKGYPVGLLEAVKIHTIESLPTEYDNVVLDKDYSYRVKYQNGTDGTNGYVFEEVDDLIHVDNSADLFDREATMGAGQSIVETSFQDGGFSFMANDGGQAELIAKNPVDVSTWNNAKNKIDLEMWVYSTKDPQTMKDVTHGIELSAGETNDDPSEYEWNASDIYFNQAFKIGFWNRVVFKISEPRQAAAEPDLTAMRYFRHFYEYPADAKNGIYFSNIRLIESSAQAGIIGYAKVLQHFDAQDVELHIGDEVDPSEVLTLSTRLRNTPGLTDTVQYVSSDPTVAKIEDGKLVVLKKGTTTLSATVEGDDRYEAGEGEVTLTILNEQEPISITSAATATYGQEYTISATGGSGDGAISYAIVDGGTGTATIDGAKLTITKPGTILLQATKAGTNDYYAAESEVFTLTAGKAAITVTIQNREVLVNTALPSAYDFTLTSGTLVGNDVLTQKVQISFSTTAKIDTAGTYDVTGTATSDYYDVTVVKGTLTVKAETTSGGNNQGDGNNQGGDDGKKGCGSAALTGGSAVIGGCLLLAALAIAVVRLPQKAKRRK